MPGVLRPFRPDFLFESGGGAGKATVSEFFDLCSEVDSVSSVSGKVAIIGIIAGPIA